MNKEFVFTKVSDQFMARIPELHKALWNLFNAANKCFGRVNQPRQENPKLDSVVFGLGHSCRDDFHECMFLAVNEHGDGARKILRVLFEKAVTVAYLLKHPDLLDKFIKYYPINIWKVWAGAELAGVSQDAWDALVGVEEMKVSSIRDHKKKNEELFQETDCKKCGTTKQKVSWDIDLASMVRKVGNPYREYYLPAYAIANLSVHTNIFTAHIGPDEDEKRRQLKLTDAYMAIAASMGLMVDIIKKQNEHFGLNIEQAEILNCENSFTVVRDKLLGKN